MLRVLEIPNNSLPQQTLCDLAAKFTSLTSVDLTASPDLSGACVEAFGKNCPNITDLKVNMIPMFGCSSANDEVAIAVGKTMPQLEHLEMAFGTLSIAGLRFVMEMCPKIRALDLRGCRHVDTDDALAMESIRSLAVFHPPRIDEEDDDDFCDEDDDYFDDKDDDYFDDDDDDDGYNFNSDCDYGLYGD
jgi:hypothetical protein